jgi:hypothetical protein
MCAQFLCINTHFRKRTVHAGFKKGISKYNFTSNWLDYYETEYRYTHLLRSYAHQIKSDTFFYCYGAL